MTDGIRQVAENEGVPFLASCVGGMFGLLFTKQKQIVNFAEVGNCDTDAFKVFFHSMLKRGIYLAPSAFEAGFISSAHTDDHIAATIVAASEAFASY